MEIFYIVLGAVFVILGCISAYAYITNNKKMFWKKQRMIDFWGKGLGTVIHFIGYVIIPIVFGIFLILKGLK